MKARIYPRGERFHVVWQAARVYRNKDEAQAAAELPYPPPPQDRARLPAELREFIRALRDSGDSDGKIADLLNRTGVPCGNGGREWYAATIRKIYGENSDMTKVNPHEPTFDASDKMPEQATRNAPATNPRPGADAKETDLAASRS